MTRLRPYLQIARVDHWIKNVFVLPGIVAAAALNPDAVAPGLPARTLAGLLAVGLVASSNYTLNEVLDASYDRHHPAKRNRPVPSGLVNPRPAYLQWVGLGLAGIILAWGVSSPLAATMLAFWLMGCLYNIPPLRSKDRLYLDVVSEAVNNPLRLLAGWYIATDENLPPATLLAGYFLVGCYFMGIKRLAELRQFAGQPAIAAYRRSLARLTEENALIAVSFYGAAAMLFFGAFIMRYRLELILAFPVVAMVMAEYLRLAFQPGSAAQHPEHLYRERRLMAAVVLCVAVMAALLFIDLPWLHRLASPTLDSVQAE